MVVKTDASGHAQWNVTLSDPQSFTLWDAFETSDGGYILAGEGFNASDPFQHTGVCLIKLSEKGVPLWNRTYGFFFIPMCAEQTADGGYILTGDHPSGINLLKVDSNGDIQWNNTYGGGLSVLVHQLSDGGYIVAGQDYEGRLFLLWTDPAGNMVSNHTYGEMISSTQTCISAIATSDGGYVITAINGSNLVLDKIASNGTLLWQQTYGGNWVGDFWLFGRGCGIQQTSDGGYIISGTTAKPPNNDSYPSLLKVDGRGAVLWMKSNYEASFSSEWSYSVVQSPDGGYVVAGIDASHASSAFIAKLAASPTYASPSPLFMSLVVAVALELEALVLLVVIAVNRKVH